MHVHIPAVRQPLVQRAQSVHDLARARRQGHVSRSGGVRGAECYGLQFVLRSRKSNEVDVPMVVGLVEEAFHAEVVVDVEGFKN